jgi:hypothetical protein
MTALDPFFSAYTAIIAQKLREFATHVVRCAVGQNLWLTTPSRGGPGALGQLLVVDQVPDKDEVWQR